MIDKNKWTKDFVGKWVKYTGKGMEYLSHKVTRGKIGKIKFRSGSNIFVVYECGGNWNKFRGYVSIPTEAEDLKFCGAGPMTKSEIYHKIRDYDSSVRDVNGEEDIDNQGDIDDDFDERSEGIEKSGRGPLIGNY